VTRRGQGGDTKKTAPKKGAAAASSAVTGVTAGRGKKAATKTASAARRSEPAKEPDGVPPQQRAFAANLARLRAAAGLTQDQLAAKSGVSQSHISALEKGTWEPRLSTILALAKAFGVAPAAFVPGWDGD